MSYSELGEAIYNGRVNDALQIIHTSNTDVNEYYKNQTVLGHAVEKGMSSVVELLISKGANPNLQNYLGDTPIMTLLREGRSDSNNEHAGFVKSQRNASNRGILSNNTNQNYNFGNNNSPILTNYDIIFNTLVLITDLEIKNKQGDTALLISVQNEKNTHTVVDKLIQAGANISQTNNDGYTVFHIFCNRDDSEREQAMLQGLTRFSTPAIINLPAYDGVTAFELAIAYSKYRTAEHLLYKGALLTDTVKEILDEVNDGPLLEVVEHLMRSEEVLPPMKPTDLAVLFGVELEICLKLTPECAQESGKRQNPEIFNTKTWQQLFAMFAKFMLKKSPLAEKMRKRYEYMYVSGGEKYGANYTLNLSTFQVEQMPATMTVGYDKPFFTIDRSVVCADYKTKLGYNDPRPSYMPAIEDTFHIELVSPIMTDVEELKDLLEFLGMQRPSCFVANDSAGFHVNVSLLNKRTNRPIPLTSDFFTRTFFPRYSVWEAKVYPKVRQEIDTSYAKCIGGTDAEKYPALYHEICKHKYVSLHRKTPRQLVEFRLFGSSNKISDLLHYTRIATEFLKNTYLEWYSFYRPNLEDTAHQILQKRLQLQKSLLNVKSRLRTRKTRGLLSKRNNIQRTLQTLPTFLAKNAKTRKSALQSITNRQTGNTTLGKNSNGNLRTKGSKAR